MVLWGNALFICGEIITNDRQNGTMEGVVATPAGKKRSARRMFGGSQISELR